jgi:CHAT domain-containing protein
MRTWILQSVLFGFIMFIVLGVRPVLGGALDDGKVAAMHGDYCAAVTHWSKLVVQPDHPQRLEALIRRGEAYRALGHYLNAQTDLSEAQATAQEAGKTLMEAVATQTLGYVNFLLRDLVTAEMLLRTSLEQAIRLQRPTLAAASANSLGSVLSNLGRMDEAKGLYEKALALAQQAGDPGLEVAARLNRARLLSGEEALAELRAARVSVAAVALPYERAELLLGIALAIKKDDPTLRYHVLHEALSIAEDIGASRLKSLAAGHLAVFYEDRGHLAKARTLTEQAIQAAQGLGAHDLLLHWEGQLGRLMRAQGDSTAAIDAYRRAIYHFQSIRQDIILDDQNGRSSFFGEILAPIYLGLVDLLLQQVATETDVEKGQALLREARDTVEKIKVSELRDYFRDPCIVAKTKEVEDLSPTIAVLYPIILPDRLELLVSIGRHLHRRVSAVDSDRLTDVAMLLSYRLRNRLSFKPEAHRIYQWLIQPIIPLLEKHAVDTLVFVPDGPLRLLPIAALSDGQRYLVERYAIATAPALTLLDPRPPQWESIQCLLAGLSRPGPVVGKLSDAMRHSLVRGGPLRSEHRRRGVPITVSDLQTLPPPELREREITADEVAEMLELPGVKGEIAQLSQQLKGKVLMDDEFRLKRFVGEVESQPFQVVHIASHGFFGDTAEDSFILTYDDKLDLNGLAGLLAPKQLAERPVELLVLSACQTAEGNDRTPLGLSGVAVKSGARSALGSLWPVYDEAARELLPAFYAHLRTPGVTKAQALQRAQLELLRSDEFAHPTFWAPFILVGNWL